MEFTFDEVLGAGVDQDGMFDRVKGLVGSVVDGYNVTIFCYGQTGSGKTHTMSGGGDGNMEEIGIIPRSINRLFDLLEAKKPSYTVKVKSYFVELYCNRLIDLYRSEVNKMDKLEIKLDATRMVYVKGAAVR